jgi:hypothetical protein
VLNSLNFSEFTLTATAVTLFISEELRGQSVITLLAGNKRGSELFFPFQMPKYIRTAWTHSQVSKLAL